MKKLFSSIVAVALSIWCYTLLFAALADVANKTWSVVDEDADSVTLSCTLAFSATDSTNDLTTQAINMYGFLAEGATVQFVADGETGRDVDIFVRGSNVSTALTTFASFYTRAPWADFSADAANSNTLFDLSNTYQDSEVILSSTADTALKIIPDLALRCKRFVFETDGQAGNTVGAGTNSTIIYVRLKKDPNIRLPNYTTTVIVESTT